MVWLKAAAAISTYAWARARPGRSRPCLRAMPLAPAQSPLHTASDAEIKNAPSRCFRLRANNCHAPSAVRDGSALLCPWFHLNSRLAGAHSIPITAGTGGPFPARSRRKCLRRPASEGLHRPPSLWRQPGGYCFAPQLLQVFIVLYPARRRQEAFLGEWAFLKSVSKKCSTFS